MRQVHLNMFRNEFYKNALKTNKYIACPIFYCLHTLFTLRFCLLTHLRLYIGPH